MSKTYTEGKTIPDLDKKTAAQITDKTKWSVEIGSEDSPIKESNSMLLSQLETLIGGSGGGSRIQDTDNDTYVDTEKTADVDIVEIGSPVTGTALIARFVNGSATEVLQVDGNGAIFNNGISQLRMWNPTATPSIFVGTSTLPTIFSSSSVFIGDLAGSTSAGATGTVAIGYRAGRNVTGVANVFIGYYSGDANTSSTTNTYVGNRAGQLNNASANIFLGNNAGRNQTSLSNSLIIDNQNRGSAATELTDSLIVGEFNATKASQWLQINGNLLTFGRQPNLITKSGLYNITSLDEYLLLDGTSFVTTVTLPTISSSNHGKIYKFKCINATQTVTISTDGSDTLDEAAATSETLNLNDKRIYIADNTSSKWIRLN